MQKIILTLLNFYRTKISTLMAPRCRFYPSCSRYAVDAVTAHGSLKGSILAIKRIFKCHPFHPGGIDEVPQAKHSRLDLAEQDQPECEHHQAGDHAHG